MQDQARPPGAGVHVARPAAPVHATGWFAALAILPLVLAALAVVWLPYLPNRGGRMGADYSYFLPNLLAGYYWHVRNGFFSVPWFSPSQCGGVPLQANPQGGFLSLPQFLTFVLPPVGAVQVCFFAFAAIGYAGCFRLARICRLSVPAAILAAALFALNSFYASRMVVGHLAFSLFMLLPLAGCCLLGVASRVSDQVIRCCGFALLLAAMLEGGMLVLVPPVYLSLLIVVALHAVVARDNSPLPLWRLGAGTLLGLLLCAGKLAAVMALMSHVPRDAYKLPGYLNIAETLWVAGRALFIGPSGDMRSHLANAEVFFQRHEFEYNFGPAALVLLMAGGVVVWRQRAWPAPAQRLAFDALVVLLLVPLAVNTYGEVWTGFLKTLPVIRNSSSLLRWLAAYILPVVLACGLALDRLAAARLVRPWMGTAAAGLVTLAALLLSDRRSYGPAEIGGYDPAPIEASWRAVASGGEVPPVKEIFVLKDASGTALTKGLARQDGMTQGRSQLFCYEPIFGYYHEGFPQGALHPGGVFEQTGAGTPGGARLNLKNPACYVFPGANACKPGDAFSAADIDQAARFVSYKPFSWRKPEWARLADWAGYIFWPITLLSLIFALVRRTRLRSSRTV